MNKRIIKINLIPFKEFVQSEAIGGVLLIICVIISLVIANSSLAQTFQQFLNKELGVSTLFLQLKYPIIQWINDGLMAIFFLLVGLEIKRELIEGELSTPKKATLPIAAAFGGAIIPAIIFLLFNRGTNAENGWGIPMATDIAFALGVLSLLNNKVPASLKIFLAALAIVDDLIAILVIAIFYSTQLHLGYLAMAIGIFAFMLLFNRFGVKNLGFYLILGMFMWYLIHHSGIHATIAGVLTAMTIPTTEGEVESPLEKLEHFLIKPVNFIIMPIFALANTNIPFQGDLIDGITSNFGLGILVGLFLGKPIGIMCMSRILVKLKLGKLPNKANWSHILGLGFLGGIGFTMSIFIALLSFKDPELQTKAKFAILITSTLSGIVGFIVLTLINKRKPNELLT
ncbi:Na+/H+ antiporter NhaA [Solitalea longa]|uniref:Na(+)/H(+) antiporter NhaA n=1 Tax=Solitalea longa TaxID=2079460 RepID=A0A2S5A1J1_9SPHI|nr:Na+/H+ antiporter NhaA [Solitalea longa]POY36451.1 Na+/H+ antiporter NhaA [Solitalea longa]